MSFITFQVGQCGNQLGYSLFDIIYKIKSQKPTLENYNFLEESQCRYFSDSENEEVHYARSILIDTERKVLDGVRVLCKDSGWRYRDDSVVSVRQLGAGNNWALGYQSAGSEVLEAARRETERCDRMQGFLLLGSVAGGTGSGLGSALSETLRDNYPGVPSVSVTVWPFQRGEVSVQSYNAVLSLASLQKSSDAIVMLENDWLQKLCLRKMGLRRATLHDLNAAASQQLANFLLPMQDSYGSLAFLSDLLSHLCPHPHLKLLGLRGVPQEPLSSLPYSAHTWPGLIRSLRTMLLHSTLIDEVYGWGATPCVTTKSPPVSLSNLLVLRGRDSQSVDPLLLHQPSLPYAKWVPQADRLKTFVHPEPLLPYDRTALLVNNGQLSVESVDAAASKAWKMLQHRAYLHHYIQYGVTSEDFVQAMAEVEQIIATYKALGT